MKIKRHIGLSAIILLVITAIAGCTSGGGNTLSETKESADSSKVEPVITKYGLPIDNYNTYYDTVKLRQTIAEILFDFGFTAQQIHKLTQCPDSIFDVRKIRPGQACLLVTE